MELGFDVVELGLEVPNLWKLVFITLLNGHQIGGSCMDGGFLSKNGSTFVSFGWCEGSFRQKEDRFPELLNFFRHLGPHVFHF